MKKNAVDGRSHKITRNVLLQLNIFDVFLVVPNFATTIIIIDDWLICYKVELKYLIKQIEFLRRFQLYPNQVDGGLIPAAQVFQVSIECYD